MLPRRASGGVADVVRDPSRPDPDRPRTTPGAFDRIRFGPYHSRSRGGAAVARRAHNPKVRGSNPLPATSAFSLNPGSRPTRGSSLSGVA